MASAPGEDGLRESIYNAAGACEALFDQLLIVLSEAGAEHYNAGRQICSSFERWAGFLGVFAAESVSLDRRLESSPQIRNRFLRLLAVVQRNAKHAIGFESARRPIGSPKGKGVSGPSSEGGISPGTQAALQGMQDALENLHRIGAATRRTSTSSLKFRVTKFMQSPKEKNVFDFYQQIDLLVVKGLYPGIPPSLAEQLAESVSFRRARLKFQRSRQKKLETKRSPAPQPKEPTQQTEPGPSAALAEPSGDRTKRNEASSTAPSAHGPSVAATDLTPVDDQLFHQSLEAEESPKKTLGSSGPLTVSGIGYANPYPRLPNSPQCNWCFRDHKVFRGEDGWKQAWKNHFKHDLQPYFCISEQCSSDLQYFVSLREWRHHMNNQHSLGWIEEIHRPATWFCETDDHPYQDFPTENELRSHLQSAHPGRFDLEQQDRAVKRNVVYVSRASDVCPLCKTDVESLRRLADAESQDSTPPPAQPTAMPPPLPPKKPAKRLRFTGIADPENSDEEDHHPSSRMRASEGDELAAAKVEHWRTNQILLGTHIASHLKSLAFRSLRYFDDVQNEENDKRSERVASGAEEEVLSSAQGQGDHYFELDELNSNPDESFPEQDVLERPADKDTPELTVEAQNNFDTIQKARLREHNPGMLETDNTQREVATSYSVSDTLDSLYENGNDEITSNFPSGFELQYWPETLINSLVQEALIRNELSEAHEPYSEELVRFVLRDGKKLFTIAAVAHSDRRWLLKATIFFMENGFKDSWLSAEVCSPPKCLTKETLTQLDSKLWGRGRAVRICETQWKFIVPVLSTERVNYDFEEEAILPFTNMQTVDGGAFSKVHQVRIQEGHFIDPSRPRSDWPSLFAVKQIVPPDSVERQRIADSWANEAQTLRRMNVVHSEHIVRFITAFTRLDIGSERSHYLVFEWAEGGNLENLFTQCQNPTLSANLVKQTVRQLSGLAEALRATHELGIRHGDIKPSNVLRFGASEGDILGTLKIGDWGLAKSHPDATVLRSRRGVATDTRFGTVLYEPPEVELGQLKLMSRLYDIWSMGCLILEIIVWLVHGYEGVRNLRSDIQGSYRERVPYYVVDEVSDGKLKGKLQDAVEKWMDYMAEEPAFDRDTALGQLLVLVRRRLLVVELPPEMGNTVYAKNWEPDSLDSRAGKNPAFSLRPPTPAGEKSEKSGSPRQYRATSAELVAALGLGGIMDASDRPRYYWLNTSAGLRQAPRFYRNANLKALQDSSGMLTPQDLRPLSINSPTILQDLDRREQDDDDLDDDRWDLRRNLLDDLRG